MELSDKIQHLYVKEFKKQNDTVSEKTNLSKEYDIVFCHDDLINIDAIDFSNDETWLCGNSGKSNIKDVSRWLYEGASDMRGNDFYSNHLTLTRDLSEPKRIFDTRTFTRPKKKYNRPSIEHYNEEMYDSKTSRAGDMLSQEIQNYNKALSKCTDSLNTSIISEDSGNKYIQNEPLHFDLGQPSSGNIFDTILMNASDIDSFQNMSPPSLVNSMCSSTFTNLMENSFIKNDPILREIRDADYSSEILINDSEPPLCQSFTESCSSLNSDSAENFLRKTLPTLNGTFNLQSQDSTCNSDAEISNNTIIKNESVSDMNITNPVEEIFDGTFVKNNTTKELNYSNNLNNSCVIEGNLNNTFKRNITKDISYDMSSSSNSDIQCDSGGGMANVCLRKLQNDQSFDLECESDKTFNKETNNFGLTDVYFNNGISGSTTAKKKFFDKTHSENIDPNTIINTKPSAILNGTFRKSSKFNNSIQKSPDVNVRSLNDFTNQLNNTVSLDNDLDDPLNTNISYNITDEPDDHKNCTYNPDLVCATADLRGNSAGYVTGSTDSLDHMSSLSNSSRGSNRMLNMAEVDAIVEEQERSLHIMSTPKPAKSMTKLFENQQISPIIRQKEHVSDSDLSSTDDYLTGRSAFSKVSPGHSEKNLKILDRNVKSLSNLKQCLEPKVKPHNVHTITKPVSNNRPFMGSYTNLRGPESNIRGSYSNLKTVGTTLKGSYTNLKPVGVNLPVITSKPSSAPVSYRNVDLDQTQVLSNVYKDEVFKVPQPSTAQVKPPNVPHVKPQARSSCLPRPIATGIPRPSKIPGPRSLRPPSAHTASRLANKPNEGYY